MLKIGLWFVIALAFVTVSFVFGTSNFHAKRKTREPA